ncbi:PAS domain S-box protein [Pseudopedobacter sp.]|uniref:PAS domain S-box protein n=1 Tax=Pseudopedobacter sp. TaxID=1936787 RepID=UPI00333F0C2E
MKNGSKKITLSYLLISISWIFFSGTLIDSLSFSSPSQRHWLEIYKGLGFIILTAFFLYKIIDRYYKNLQRSEEQYKDMFKNNPNPMWVYDLKTLKFLEANQAAITKYGYSAEEFLSMSILDIRPVDEASRLRDYIQKKELKKSESGIWRHILKNGTIISANIISHNIVFDKKPAKLVLALDVSQKELYEKELEKQQFILQQTNEDLQTNISRLQLNQQKLSNTQKIAKIAGWTYDLEKNVFDFDSEFFELTKLPVAAERLLNLEQLFSFVHPDDIQEISNFIAGFKHLKHSQECTVRIKNHDDWSFIRFEAFIPAYFSEECKFLEGFIQDINELTKANMENKRLDEIINRIKNLIIITNQHGEIEWANTAFYETTEYSREEIIGKRPWEFINIPESSLENLNMIQKAVEKVEDFSVEIENFSKHGRHFWLQIDGSPIFDEKGCHAGYIAIENEITDRKQKDARINEQRNLLSKAAWINSHQVRKPLASILGLIELMHLARSEAEIKEYLNLLEICGNELDDLIKTSVNLVGSDLKDISQH